MSVERLTVKRKDGRWALANNDGASNLEQLEKLPRAIDRLAAYEDIGLEPEEIRAALEGATREFAAYDELGTIDHLRDLVQAEQDGRLLMLDEKLLLSILAGARSIENNRRLFGVTYCWDIWGRCGGPKEISYYKAAKLLREMVEPILTREEAEAALKGETNENDPV